MFYSSRHFLYATTLLSLLTLVGNLVELQVVLAQRPVEEISSREEALLNEAKQLNQQVGQLYRQGKYAQAIPLAEEALKIRQQILGEQHLSVATSLNNLAFLYQRMGRYEDALPLFQDALKMNQSLLPEQHLQVAQSLSYLAFLYQQMGRYEDALPLFQDALKMNQSLLPEQHPDIAASLNNLAELYYRIGRYKDALPLFQDALKMNQSLLPEQHLQVATSLNNLAALYQRMGKYKDALPLFQDALLMFRTLLGEQHPDVATSLNNLAFLYQRMGKYEDALPLFQDALLMFRTLLGEQHPDVSQILNNLAFLYKRMGRYEDALPLFQDTLQIRQSLLGEQHPDVAISLSGLASLHQAQGQIDLALQFLQESLEIQELNLERILSTGSEGQKEQYMKTISWARDRSISLHLQSAPDHQPATHLALTTTLRRKGRLLDFLAQSQQILRQSLDPKSQQLLTDLNQTRTAIANLYNRSTQLPRDEYQAQLLRELSETEGQLVAQISSHSRQLAQSLEPVTIEQVQNRLPQEGALVEFFQYRPYNPQDGSWRKRRYAVYVLRAQGQPQGVDLGEVEDLKPLLERFHLSVQTRNLTAEEWKKAAQDLDEKLMAKVRPLLGNARHLFIAPDQELNVIPFEALVDETNSYLIETYQFTYLQRFALL